MAHPVTRLLGLISDTHGLLRPGVHDALSGVELILHAGDVGGSTILDELRLIAPVKAVFGNTDPAGDPDLAEEILMNVGGNEAQGSLLGQSLALDQRLVIVRCCPVDSDVTEEPNCDGHGRWCCKGP